MPVGAFVVFMGSFLIFAYLFYDDYTKTAPNERSTEETVWIYIFFAMLAGCIFISGLCVFKTNPELVKPNKKLGERFGSVLSAFSGSVIN